MDPRVARGVAFAALLFLLVQLGALALVPTFHAAGYQQVEDPADPANSLLYVGAILVATVLMLAAFRYDLDWVVRGVVVLTSGLLAWYVLGAVLPGLVALALSAGLAVALYVYPEWYVIDTAGVLMGAGAAGLFGISFGVLPAIILLAVLAVYDAISVYGTEHMLDLAEGVMGLRIPVVLVIPLSLSYSILGEGFEEGEVDRDGVTQNPAAANGGASGAKDGGAETGGEPESEADGRADDEAEDLDRDAFFIGLGDAVMPSILVASAAFFSPAAGLAVPLLPALNLPALLAMGGTFVGLFALLAMVLRGRAHAGLPLLNGGAIGGYLLGSLLVGIDLVTALGLAPYL